MRLLRTSRDLVGLAGRVDWAGAGPRGLTRRGAAHAPLGEPEQPADEGHRSRDQQRLVPAALVGEQRDRGHAMDATTTAAGIFGGSNWLNTSIDTSLTPETAPRPTKGVLHAQVVRTIEVIRPALQADGGDIILHDVDEDTGVVKVELIGACVGCPASTQTLKAGIERIMRDRIDGVTEVIDVA